MPLATHGYEDVGLTDEFEKMIINSCPAILICSIIRTTKVELLYEKKTDFVQTKAKRKLKKNK